MLLELAIKLHGLTWALYEQGGILIKVIATISISHVTYILVMMSAATETSYSWLAKLCGGLTSELVLIA